MDSSSRPLSSSNSSTTSLVYQLKGEAAKLQALAKSRGEELTRGAALEMVAHRHGFKDWNAASAAARQPATYQTARFALEGVQSIYAPVASAIVQTLAQQLGIEIVHHSALQLIVDLLGYPGEDAMHEDEDQAVERLQSPNTALVLRYDANFQRVRELLQLAEVERRRGLGEYVPYGQPLPSEQAMEVVVAAFRQYLKPLTFLDEDTFKQWFGKNMLLRLVEGTPQMQAAFAKVSVPCVQYIEGADYVDPPVQLQTYRAGEWSMPFAGEVYPLGVDGKVTYTADWIALGAGITFNFEFGPPMLVYLNDASLNYLNAEPVRYDAGMGGILL